MDLGQYRLVKYFYHLCTHSKLRSFSSLPLALANGLHGIKKEGFSQNSFQLG